MAKEQFEDLKIVGGKYGKVVSIAYEHKREDRMHDIEDEEVPHPDLRKAFNNLIPDLAHSHWVDEMDKQDTFSVHEFSITDDDTGFFVTLKGKVKTIHGEEVSASSGKIPIEEGLVHKVQVIRSELFKYFFEGKVHATQGSMNFENKEGDGNNGSENK